MKTSGLLYFIHHSISWWPVAFPNSFPTCDQPITTFLLYLYQFIPNICISKCKYIHIIFNLDYQLDVVIQLATWGWCRIEKCFKFELKALVRTYFKRRRCICQ